MNAWGPELNAWGIVLAWLAVQVSVFLLAGAAVYGVVRRRNPAAGAWALAAVLIAVIGLSAIAASPWPQWWSVDAVWLEPNARAKDPGLANSAELAGGDSSRERGEATNLSVNETVEPASEAALAGAWREFLAGFQNSLLRAEEANVWRWPAWLAVALLGFIAVGLVRLAVGLLAARRFGTRAALVDNAEVLDTLNELRRELACLRGIELRVATHLGSPCTLGWFRPIVILPADWAAWNASELRSVLAHEVAHVARGDFGISILAQLGAVLHFYNPLAWWLLGRLRLEQEMAADLCGARLAGGRQAYLTTLARMALRQSDLPWGVRAFLPARGTLLRRVEMLHKETRLPEGSISWSGRMAVAMLLLFAGGLLAGVRGPSESTAIAAPPEKTSAAVAPTIEEVHAIVKSRDIRLELQQLQADYNRLEAFIRENPSRVTPEIQQAHRYLGQRIGSAARDFALHFELLLGGVDRKVEGAVKAEPGEQLGIDTRDADAKREAWKASLERLDVIRREHTRYKWFGLQQTSAQEYSKARRELREAELAKVDIESDANPLPAWKDLSPADRHAAARKAYFRQSSMDQLKTMGIAFLFYHDVHKRFPTAVEMGPDGKTPHSWRVALLPYLGENGEELYKRYRLDEPWESEHNKQIIAEGAHFYNVPSEIPSNETGYFVFTGPGTVFDPEAPVSKIRSIPDGTSRTLGVVEAQRAIPWTKPEDLPYSLAGPLPKLGGNFEGGFTCQFMDGSAHFIPADIEEPVLRALISKAGKEVLSNEPKTGRFKVGS
jgi:beta-lactamase regulating signal transducer with metallopeptidase domain